MCKDVQSCAIGLNAGPVVKVKMETAASIKRSYSAISNGNIAIKWKYK